MKKQNVSIRPGTHADIAACIGAIRNSTVGRRYFKDPSSLKSTLSEGISKKALWVARDKKGNCLGYIWYMLQGTFCQFPYLRSIAVDPDHRNKGIGSMLLGHFEREGFKKASHVFLLSSDFNTRAQKLYLKRGYKRSGRIKDLFIPGIDELLFVKNKKTR